MRSSQGKVRTRGADTKYRLTVEELQLFANQLETLPAKVAGHTGVSGLLAQVAQFQGEASRLLEAETVELEVVERCLEKGEGLEIELIEVGQLRAKAEQLAWLEEMAELLSEPGEVRVDSYFCWFFFALSSTCQPLSGLLRFCKLSSEPHR